MNNEEIHKLDMKSKDIVEDNISKISELFPDCINEGKIDFDMLKQELSKDIIENKKEKYQLTWVGKKESLVKANTPCNKTLRPVKEKSVDFDNTKNIYIEGDNLESLKILQESYLNKIKCIYIDPPYNTGNDFVYVDNFKKNIEVENIESGQIDEYENRLITNVESNGRFHSDWLTMMYPRLKLARNLLTNDGAIFISIDDHEIDNLKKICNELFGEPNYIATFVWQRSFSPVNLNKFSSQSHDYILCYAKNLEKLDWYGLPRSEEANLRYSNPDNDPRGPWTSGDFSVGPQIEEKVYPITLPSGRIVYPPSGRCWRVTKEKFTEMVNNNQVWFGENGDGVPRQKRFLSDVKQYITPMTVWTYEEVGHTQEAKKDLNNIFDGKAYFDYPKSLKLMERIIGLCVKNDDIVLDFFSGSATTAHAVMNKNINLKSHIRYIMVQIPEILSEKTEAYKAGYQTICDIGEERIRRAGNKIKKEANADIDYGFRVYKVDSSNMKDVYYVPTDLKQSQLNMFESNIKEDRTSEDLLTQVILDLGLTLDLSIEEKKIFNNNVYFVENNSLVACFDDTIDINIVDEICKCNPLKIVFKESSFKTDSDKINTFERIKKISQETEVNVI